MSYAQDITRYYGGDWHGTQGAFPTPGHGKSDRGMTVRDGDNGDVIFYSHNGGDWRAVKDECRAKGLIPDRPRPLDSGRSTLRAPRIRDVGAWEYTDADGVTLYRKVRMALSSGGKSYRFEHPDGRGGWNPKRGPAPQVPYRLPDILAAEHAAILYMAEGEKQADKLASWGFLATSSKDWLRQFDHYVAGRTVVILPDNDAEGERIANEAKASVERVGGKALILNLPGLPPKGDVMDWAGNADELRALTEAALNPPVPMLSLLDPAGWAGVETPARVWALYEMILVGQVTYLTGAGATGKSLLGQQLATCIAVGLPFLGLDVRQGVALYLTCEDDADELHRRQKAICSALNVHLDALSGRLHLASLAGMIGNELAVFDPQGRMASTDAWQRLRATVIATGATFVVLDNVAHLFAGNENIRNQVAAFLSLLNGLAADTGAAILLIGHPNKAGADFSGSTAWENQVRSRLFLGRAAEADGTIIDPDARVLTKGKVNYAQNGEKLAFRWHQWAFVRDADLPPNVGAEIAATIAASHDNSVFLACLDERNRQQRAVSENKASRTYAPKEFAEMVESKGVGRARLEAAMDRLFRIGAIERGFLWRDAGEGKDRYGLRLTSADPAGSSADLSADLPLTGSADLPMTTRRPPLTHTPISKEIEGAAQGAAAPSLENEAWSPPDTAGSSRLAASSQPGRKRDPFNDDDWPEEDL